MGDPYNIRLTNRFTGQGLAISPEGTTVAAMASGPTIPLLLGEGEFQGESGGQPLFRVFEVPAGYAPEMDLFPVDLSRFDNGARILGLSYEELPAAGQPWPVVLVWSPEREHPDGVYNFSIRLVDLSGQTTYAQVDIASLGFDQWRTGDTVLSPADLPVSDQYPGGPIKVMLLMYATPDFRGANAIIGLTQRTS